MKRQLEIFFAALMFFTRIPVPKHVGHHDELLQQSSRYFPWVGIVVGIIAAGTLWLCHWIFGPILAVLISMSVSILVTGAFHEDGFADVCDAFGGGWTKERILVIMKDSRLGTYGVIGLIAILALKYALLVQLLDRGVMPHVACIYVAAHSLSRFMAVTLMQQYPYVTDTDVSKSKPAASRRLTASGLLVAGVGALLPFALLPPAMLAVIVPAAGARMYLGRYFHRWIGGYTGDCAGATQQVCEITVYLGALLIWKYI